MQRALLVLGLMISLAATGCANRRACNECNGPLGCRPCQIGWQRGGHDYGRHLSYSNTGQAPEGQLVQLLLKCLPVLHDTWSTRLLAQQSTDHRSLDHCKLASRR